MSENNGSPPKFGIRKNVKLIGRTDIAGGGQVVVENGYAYVGRIPMILDLKDPTRPKGIRTAGGCPASGPRAATRR